MLEQRSFSVEPWAVREAGLDLDLDHLGHAESVFALANGHIGLRGNLDEGDPHGLPGTYLNSFFEHRPLPYAEGGYGYPESGQAIVNVTNGKLIRLMVDEPLDVRYGQLRSHERVLDLRAIAAKGLTGTGYDGHTFWDTETFVLPMLSHTVPDAAADALRWRQQTLPQARERAAQLGLSGAAFPWRTVRGVECSGYWPAGTAAFHINADIADAAIRHVDTTADVDFEREVACELLVETARLWSSLGQHGFRIDGVTGPDE